MPKRILLLALIGALAGVQPAIAAGATARICAFLGDRLNARGDTDTYTLAAGAGESLAAHVAAVPDPGNAGAAVRLLVRPGLRRAVGSASRTALPLDVEGTSRRAGTVRVAIRRMGAPGVGFRGRYCLSVTSSGDAATTLAPAADVEVEWVALDPGPSPRFPPFLPARGGEWSGLLQPLRPLAGGRVYGVIVTSGVRGLDGTPLEAAPWFRTLKGTREPSRGGPVALFSPDAEAPENPYPEARLVRSDGTVRVPDGVAMRGLDAQDPGVGGARAYLRHVADEIEALHGFSTASPVAIALAGPGDLRTVTPASVLVFERTDRRLDTEGLLAEARRHGVHRRDVALAISFPTQPIEEDLRSVRARLLELQGGSTFGAILDDPDPGDDLPLGVFGAQDASPFQSYLASNPQVSRVVAGLLPSREFRDARGLFDPAVVSGATPPERVLVDFLLTLPAGVPPPFRVVVFQHGFAGSNASVLDQGALLARHGLAVIGISAVSHGRRGSFATLISSTPRQLGDIFRQTNADQMALVRMLEAGVDVDHDGAPDLDASELGYLGISLGGLMGGPLVAVEDRFRSAALVVMSGRFVLNGQAPTAKDIYESALAKQVGLTVGTPAFDVLQRRALELGQHAADAADALNFARRWRDQPFPGAEPRRILLQEGAGDTLVFNALTEELARAAGFVSNVPQRDAAGVAGHWLFDPPGGHGISARADVRQQSALFLATRGTTIADPSTPAAPEDPLREVP